MKVTTDDITHIWKRHLAQHPANQNEPDTEPSENPEVSAACCGILFCAFLAGITRNQSIPRRSRDTGAVCWSSHAFTEVVQICWWRTTLTFNEQNPRFQVRPCSTWEPTLRPSCQETTNVWNGEEWVSIWRFSVSVGKTTTVRDQERLRQMCNKTSARSDDRQNWWYPGLTRMKHLVRPG